MAWSQSFIDDLAGMDGNGHLFYALETVDAPYTEPFGNAWGPLHSMSESELGAHNTLAKPGSSMSSGLLRVRSWSYTAGMLTVAFGEEGHIRRLARKGQVVRFLVGVSASAMESVFVGTVNNITRRSGGWAIEVRDLLQAITSRLTLTDDQSLLFYDQAASTLVDSTGGPNYMPGDTEVEVADASGFRASTNGRHYFLVTGDSGSEFILSAGIRNGNTFEGVSTVAEFDTAAEGATTGATIKEVAVLHGHPIDVARFMLSTVSGTNKVIPSCTVDLPDEVVATTDMQDFIALSDLVNHDQARYLVITAPTMNPKSVLDNFLGPNGFFLCQAQGQITARAGVDPSVAATAQDLEIRDSDLVSVDRYEQWDPRNPAAVRTIIITTQNNAVLSFGAATDEPESLPIAEEQPVALSGVFGDTQDRARIAEEVADRVARWYWLQAEVMTVTLRGLHHGRASAGDTCKVRFSLFDDRYGGSFDGRRGLLLQVNPNWFGATTTAVIALLPEPAFTDVSAPL